MGDILNEEVLQEMYFGKRAGLLKIEEFFDIIKKRYDGAKPNTFATVCRELNKDDIVKKIGKEICEMFGFKEAAVSIANRDYFNAFTVCYYSDRKGVYYSGDTKVVDFNKFKSTVIVTNAGFTFDKRKIPIDILVCINLGCFFGKIKMSSAELVAVLLHEIGHNFAQVVMGRVSDARAGEKFADQFAGMYGYGPELASAFSKIMINRSDFDIKYKDVPVLNILVGLNQIRKSYKADYSEEHPVMMNRISGILKQMEADLKDTPNLTPGMKKDLEDQINAIKAAIKDTFDAGDNDSTGTRMTKFFFREIEPNIGAEKIGEENAYKHTSPTHLNKKISKMYHRKGWFK